MHRAHPNKRAKLNGADTGFDASTPIKRQQRKDVAGLLSPITPGFAPSGPHAPAPHKKSVLAPRASSSDEDELEVMEMPSNLSKLKAFYGAMVSTGALLRRRREHTTYENMREPVQAIVGKQFKEIHLAQIKHLCPSAFEWRYTEAPASTAKGSRAPKYQLLVELPGSHAGSANRPLELIDQALYTFWMQHCKSESPNEPEVPQALLPLIPNPSSAAAPPSAPYSQHPGTPHKRSQTAPLPAATPTTALPATPHAPTTRRGLFSPLPMSLVSPAAAPAPPRRALDHPSTPLPPPTSTPLNPAAPHATPSQPRRLAFACTPQPTPSLDALLDAPPTASPLTQLSSSASAGPCSAPLPTATLLSGPYGGLPSPYKLPAAGCSSASSQAGQADLAQAVGALLGGCSDSGASEAGGRLHTATASTESKESAAAAAAAGKAAAAAVGSSNVAAKPASRAMRILSQEALQMLEANKALDSDSARAEQQAVLRAAARRKLPDTMDHLQAVFGQSGPCVKPRDEVLLLLRRGANTGSGRSEAEAFQQLTLLAEAVPEWLRIELPTRKEPAQVRIIRAADVVRLRQRLLRETRGAGAGAGVGAGGAAWGKCDGGTGGDGTGARRVGSGGEGLGNEAGRSVDASVAMMEAALKRSGRGASGSGVQRVARVGAARAVAMEGQGRPAGGAQGGSQTEHGAGATWMVDAASRTLPK